MLNLTIQLCLGLRHLKQKGIMHRDLKLANIMISPKGLLKIADFGRIVINVGIGK
jgi:serine/threonine protein kinase